MLRQPNKKNITNNMEHTRRKQEEVVHDYNTIIMPILTTYHIIPINHIPYHAY